MNIDIDTPRGRSATSSTNSSRASLTHSNLSSISYVERMEAQSNNLSWAEHIKLNKMKEIILLYVISKVRENKSANEAIDPTPKAKKKYSNNKATILNNMLDSQDKDMANSNMNIYAL